jgi:hypothetical protein
LADRAKLTATSVDNRATVGLCAGRGCRKRCEFAKVQKALDRECDVLELKCIGLCDGPVVVVVHPGPDSPAVYSKLRTKRQRSLIVGLASGDVGARKQLSGRKVDKKKAVTSVERQLKRRVA